ncbi:uncharacterized protein LOC117176266 [Belonocnema kinseyi]|uniref:uncharacterized protein LOC117176266 n=1 Tax=Belonocnema kinseyi TaxID=2817044 RepID=UPI00143D3C6D|nr:uncharacterized protein LOC117176266 [Belonocnema kinseyi]
MNFVLLPFVLATWIPTNEEIWKNGPEYTFGMEINMIAAMHIDNGSFIGTRMAGKLKCRPKEPHNLICKIEDTKIIRVHPKGFNTSGMEIYQNESYSPYGVGRDNFLVKFNKEGIENYILEKTDRPAEVWIIDMIRLITNQLSIGADLENRRNDEQFKKLENFTVGECETEFKISRKRIVIKLSQKELKYKIISTLASKQFDFSPDEKIQIEKRRNIQNCHRRKEYFFGTRYTKGIVLRDVYNNLKSSSSRIVFSKDSFLSETTNECEIFDLEKNHLGNVLDNMKLTLEDVQPAKEELVTIPNVTYYDILAGESVAYTENHYKN